MKWLERVSEAVWNPWMLGAFLAVGLICSVRTGFFQLFGVRIWWRNTAGCILRGKETGQGEGLSALQTLCTALASTIGTGSVAGVATAIWFGGPGAVFWMWVSAFLGMMTGFVEKLLVARYRKRGQDGWLGGPMYYLQDGLKVPGLAAAFSFFCICAALAGGDLVQANSIASALSDAFSVPPLLVGVLTAALVGLVMFGGIGRIAEVSEKLVPLMAALFLTGCAVVLFAHRAALPGALMGIVKAALSRKAAMGGGAGYGMMQAMRYGIARGVFTNEAGLGSSAIAYATSRENDPVRQGMWGMLEVFAATLVICTASALVLLTSGVHDPETALRAIQNGEGSAMVGVPMASAAFASVLGEGGRALLAGCLTLFAFSSLLGWSYYGEQSLCYLTDGKRWVTGYRMVFLLVILLGSVSDVATAWLLSDLFNALMAAPNLVGILLLSGEAAGEWKRWMKKRG